MSRSLASHLAVLVIGLTLGVGAVAVAERQRPMAQPSTADERKIAREVRKVAGEVRRVQDLIGTSEYDSGSLRADLRGQLGNPFGSSVKDLLEQICRNTGSSFSC